MAQLSDLQVEFLSSEIQSRGIQLNELHDDLLDHICTAIESRMDSGEDFETAFQQTMKLFGPGGLMQVQEQTLILLTQMNETMKKLSMGFGLAATALLLAGMLFKIQHWPGAGFLLLTGNFFLVALYLPFMLIHKLKESKKADYTMLIMGFIGLGLFACGSTFKIMHWPLGNVLLWLGFLTLVIGFFPMFFFRRYKTSSNKSITLTTAMLVLIGVIQVGQLISLRGSTQYYHAMTALNQVMQDGHQQASNNAALLAPIASNATATQLTNEAGQLIDHIDKLKTHLISETEGISEKEASDVRLLHLEKLENFDVPTKILIGNYDNPNTDEFSAAYLAGEVQEFRSTVLAAYPNGFKEKMGPILGLRTDGTYLNRHGMEEDWIRHHFHHMTLVAVITHLTKLQWEIRQAENQVLIYLTAQSESPGPPSPGT